MGQPQINKQLTVTVGELHQGFAFAGSDWVQDVPDTPTRPQLALEILLQVLLGAEVGHVTYNEGRHAGVTLSLQVQTIFYWYP